LTYFGFLAVFICLPILALLALTAWDARRGIALPASLRSRSTVLVLLAHVVVAVVYTTPWDNYLVVTRVWWYRPELVVGITLGYVPIEEYTFFVLQTIFTGLWLLWLARHFKTRFGGALLPSLRQYGLMFGGMIWLASVVILIVGWQSGNYLALILVWALPPIIFQLWFGADILWRYRAAVIPALLTATIYLGVTDALAIDGGTWTINPEKSLNIFLGGILPLEEFIFFFLTNTLVVFGVTLVLAQESQTRASKMLSQRTVRIEE